MSTSNNLSEYLTSVADAIRDKKGTTDQINAQDFATEIENLPTGGGGYTGHADVEGLTAIGWTQDDIDYFQEHGVNWNEEDDEYHKVPDFNIALYGVVNASNVKTYKDKIYYLPKIDTSRITGMKEFFQGFSNMVALPLIDTSNVSYFEDTFKWCYNLKCVPELNTKSCENMGGMFDNCPNIVYIPKFNTEKVISMYGMFNSCIILNKYQELNIYNATGSDSLNSIFNWCRSIKNITVNFFGSLTIPISLDSMFNYCTSLEKVIVTSFNPSSTKKMFYSCQSIYSIETLDMTNVTTTEDMFGYCSNLQNLALININCNLDLSYSNLLSHDSLVYIINNAKTVTTTKTLTLGSINLAKLTDEEKAVATNKGWTLA